MTIGGLTQRQAQTLGMIEAFIASHGFAPSIAEIAQAIGTRSMGRVMEILKDLRERGRLDWRPRAHRSLVVVPEGARRYGLPQRVQEQLDHHCAAHGELPADVVADAVALYLDEIESAEAEPA